MLDPGFVADCPYAPEAILFDEIVEVDREAGRVVARMPTHERLPLTDLQRVHPARHPRHVSGALMVHVTGMLGFTHAYFLLVLRHAEGWIGYGTHIHAARYGRLATIGPPLLLECRATPGAPAARDPLRPVRVPLRPGGCGGCNSGAPS